MGAAMLRFSGAAWWRRRHICRIMMVVAVGLQSRPLWQDILSAPAVRPGGYIQAGTCVLPAFLILPSWCCPAMDLT